MTDTTAREATEAEKALTLAVGAQVATPVMTPAVAVAVKTVRAAYADLAHAVDVH